MEYISYFDEMVVFIIAYQYLIVSSLLHGQM